MTVFRIEKTKDFTGMSNHHLRNRTSGTAMRLMQIFETAPEIVSKIAGESENRRIVNGRERNNSVGKNIEKNR